LNPAKLNQNEMSFYEKSNKRKNDAMFFFQKYAMISHASLEGLSMITMFERRARSVVLLTLVIICNVQ